MRRPYLLPRTVDTEPRTEMDASFDPLFDDEESTMPSIPPPDFVAISEIRRTPLQDAPTVPPAREAHASLRPLYILHVLTLFLILAVGALFYITLR